MQLRRTIASAAAVLATALSVTTAAAAPPPSGRPAQTAVDRAAASYSALEQFFAAGHGLYHEQYPVEPGDNAYSYEWPFSQAHVAALDLAGMPGRLGRQHRPELRQNDAAQVLYWSTAGTTGRPGFASGVEPPYGTGGDFFYDDNEWVGLQDVQHWLFFHDRRSLRQAARIFALVVSGWDRDPAHPDPGGVFWTQANWSNDRNTVSNMPGAELGLRLYQVTGDRSYLRWAMRMYEWTNTHLQSPDGLYWDHVDLQGTIEKTFWTYNQGVPVGVNVLLYEVTGQPRYLREAERIATAGLHYFGGDRLDAQPPYFNSIWFKNLLLLQSVTHDPRYRRAMGAYAERMWTMHRDPATGLFHFRTGDAHTQLIEQAAMTQLYAVLAWSRADYRRLY